MPKTTRMVEYAGRPPRKHGGKLWGYGYADLARMLKTTEGALRARVFRGTFSPGDLEAVFREWAAVRGISMVLALAAILAGVLASGCDGGGAAYDDGGSSDVLPSDRSRDLVPAPGSGIVGSWRLRTDNGVVVPSTWVSITVFEADGSVTRTITAGASDSRTSVGRWGQQNDLVTIVFDGGAAWAGIADLTACPNDKCLTLAADNGVDVTVYDRN